MKRVPPHTSAVGSTFACNGKPPGHKKGQEWREVEYSSMECMIKKPENISYEVERIHGGRRKEKVGSVLE